MYTLHHAAEIRSIDTVDELNSVAITVKPEEMKLAKQVISTFEGPLDLADYKDEYREGLQRIIDAKIAGEEIVAPEVETPSRVVNLMDALKRSLDAVQWARRRNRPRPQLPNLPQSANGRKDIGRPKPTAMLVRLHSNVLRPKAATACASGAAKWPKPSTGHSHHLRLSRYSERDPVSVGHSSARRAVSISSVRSPGTSFPQESAGQWLASRLRSGHALPTNRWDPAQRRRRSGRSLRSEHTPLRLAHVLVGQNLPSTALSPEAPSRNSFYSRRLST